MITLNTLSPSSVPAMTTRILGDKEMARLIQSHDWEASALGPIESWPAELVAIVNTILASPLPMQVFWGSSMILLYNDALLPFLSGKHPEVLGQPAREAWKEAWPAVRDQLEGVRLHGKSVSITNVLLPILRNGVLEDIYWNYSYSPLLGPTGQVEGILNIAQDITESILAQRALRDAEARSNRILRSIGDAVIVTDAEARVTRMNGVAESLTGWPETEARGRPLAQVFHILNESSREVVESPAANVQRTGAIAGLANHTILVARDGREVHVDDSGAPIRDEEGHLSGIVLVFRDIGDRRAAERERDRLTEQLSQVLAATTDAVVSVNRDWVMTYLNPMAEKLYGPSSSVVGKNVWEAFPSSLFEGSPFVEHYHRAMDERMPGAFETYYPAPLDFWIRLEVYPTPDGIVTFSRDVSAERRALEALREKDERLRIALNAARSIGTWDWDVPSDLVYVSDESAAFYQVDPQEAAKGLRSSQFINDVHPEDLATLSEAIASAMRTGEDYRSEYRLVQADGSVRWVASLGRCRLGLDGAPLRFSGVTIDMTEVRRADEALRASEESLRIAADTARLGTWDLDLVTQRMHCSPICKANYGRAPGHPFDYEHLVSSIHPEDGPQMEAAFREAVETGSVYRSEYRVIWPDGSTHWLVASGRTVSMASGPATRMAGVTLDVTERHQAQAALMQSEKLAAVGRLAASVAHEINNPLESVTNLLYLARTAATLSPEALHYLDSADVELRRVSLISSQTLRFYKQSTSPKSVTCNNLFDSALLIYQGRLVNSRVQVHKRKRATKPVVCFDNEIRQVLNNLVGNAIDAMHPVGGPLFLRSRDATDWKTGRTGILLTVADTGPGISPPVMRRIFEAFFTTKGIGGTGLGLWVSQEIVERHSGRLRVRSTQGQQQHGTVFNLFLPSEATAR